MEYSIKGTKEKTRQWMDPLPEKCSDRKQEGPNRSRGLMSSAFGGFGFVCVTEDQ